MRPAEIARVRSTARLEKLSAPLAEAAEPDSGACDRAMATEGDRLAFRHLFERVFGDVVM